MSRTTFCCGGECETYLDQCDLWKRGVWTRVGVVRRGHEAGFTERGKILLYLRFIKGLTVFGDNLLRLLSFTGRGQQINHNQKVDSAQQDYYKCYDCYVMTNMTMLCYGRDGSSVICRRGRSDSPSQALSANTSCRDIRSMFKKFFKNEMIYVV